PTGRKWRTCRDTPAERRFLVCNADEGDPGAFMDRSVLEGNPHRVIEGMIIGSLAIGAERGFVYVRQEYPLAVERLELAIESARKYGLLGADILGSGLSFDIEIKRGGGAFVCGEESALIASIEGRRGVPRRRPPYPAVSGLFGMPTCINNVETWANVPIIIERGAGWYSRIGTKGSKGTKIFSLVGKVHNTGLVEVPMGMTLRQIIFDIGGGIPGGRSFKAVQTGGPSGGCLPESKLDIPVDFDTLVAEGAMMGSGGMIVMDSSTCMVDVARYFTGFLKFESCGNCTSCRDGLWQMHRMLERLTEGTAPPDTLERIEQLAETIRTTSLCALGTTSVNPVLSSLRYFRREFEAHLAEKQCPAGVCKALITFRIDSDKCNGCTLCAKNCPQDAIRGRAKQLHAIEQEKCIKCGICRDVCNQDAVVVE
ncbi:MAG: NADH-quinone oxidoreductase subunit F, partial [Deltaproteobacteria bacterium]